jgi:gamma-glutamylcyclotransferase (GGCT)/AIG2-like uncharacterized protein YtfP
MKHYYFAYGMNTNLDSMSTRCLTAQVMGPARLEGYRFAFRGHADVELDYASDVHGVLWQIDDEDLESLDMFEGFPHYYIRSRAWVEQDGEWYVAWVYQMNDQSRVSPPSLSYVHMCMEGYQQNGVSTTQIEDALAETMIIEGTRTHIGEEIE